MLPSIEIKNFRAFEHLKIDKLCQVNLITGKNNVGKTTLLEALHILLNFGSTTAIRSTISNKKPEEFIEHIFYGCETINTVTIDSGAKEKVTFRCLNKSIFEIMSQPGNKVETCNPQNSIFDNQLFDISQHGPISCLIVPYEGLDFQTTCKLWNRIALTSSEDDIIHGLNHIDSDISRINLQMDVGNGNKITFMAKKDSIPRPVSLKSIGGGINHLLEILTCFANVAGHTLLIDEIENGLHYTVQPKVWKLIFEMSKRLNVQVFATTHSWDCIEAFQEAATERKDVSSQLIRLNQKNGKILPTLFTPEELAIATKNDVEVR